MKISNNIKSILAASVLTTVLIAVQTAQAAESYSPFNLGNMSSTKSISPKKTSATSGYKSVISIEDAIPDEDKSIFSGAEAQMEELDKLEPITEQLKRAVDAHNTLNSLRGYQNIQKRYNQMKQLHDKSVEVLKESEQCTIDYLGRYFDNPIKIWSGISMKNNPENHDLRSGLSRWAIEMFEVAKSAQVSPISAGDLANVDETSAESFAKINAAASKDNSDEEDTSIKTDVVNYEATEIKDIGAVHKAAEKEAIATHAKNDGNYFKEPSKQEEIEKEARKTDLMANDVGSVVAVWMADYIAGNKASAGPEWKTADLGGIKKRFPVWNDQRAFYSQYLDRKYGNMRQYIKDYEIPSDIRKRISDAVFERQKKLMSQAEADITQAAYNAVNIAIAEKDTKIENVRKKYNLDVVAAGGKESSDISTLSAEKDYNISVINQKIEDAKNLRDSYATQLSDLNGVRQNLRSEMDEVRQELYNMESLLSGTDLSDEQKEEYSKNKEDAAAQISVLENRNKELDDEKTSLENKIAEQTEIIRRSEQEKSDIENTYILKVSEVKENSLEEMKALAEGLDKDIKKINDELEAKKKKIALAEKAAKATLGSRSTVTANQIIDEASIVFEAAKEDAYKNIDDTVAAMKALGDDLYRGQIQSTISSYHQALIDSLKGEKSATAALNLEPVGAKVHDITNFLTEIVNGIDSEMTTLNVKNYREKVANTKVLLTLPVFDTILKNIDTSTDTRYFVGSTPKEEDFRAPKTLPDLNLPPLREYVRLDYIDLQSIAKDAPKLEIYEYKEFAIPLLDKILKEKRLVPASGINKVSAVDKDKFLTYGGRIPEIWKLMLKDKAFVDSDFYLTKEMAPEYIDIQIDPLKLGSEMSPLYRGGVYPCVIKENTCGEDLVVDVARTGGNSTEHTMRFNVVDGERRAQILETNPPICREVAARCQKLFGKNKKVYLASLNDEKGLSPKGEIIADDQYSELGSIFGIYSGKIAGKSVKNILAYTPDMQAVVNYGLRMEERNDPEKNEKKVELSQEEQQNDDVYVRAQYNINQIGDFLSHAETEQSYKDSLDEIEETLVTMKEDLYKTLRDFGFEPSPDFDISKAADYELAVNKINAIKKSNMSQAKSAIVSIEPGNSDLLYQTKNSYNRIWEGLSADKEATVVMTMDVDNPTEFAEDIKTGTVNRNVDNEYEGEADKSFEEQMKSFKPVYCAAY